MEKPRMIFAVSRVYGNFLYYPVNDLAKEARKVFSYRSDQKTFSKPQVEFFKKIVTVETVPYEGQNELKND